MKTNMYCRQWGAVAIKTELLRNKQLLEKLKVMEPEVFPVNNIRCYTTLELVFYIGKKCKKLLKYVQS